MSQKTIWALLAAAAMAVVSCNKETDTVEPVVPGNGIHTVVFKADEIASKTSLVLDGTTYSALWTSADEGNFHIFENGVSAASFGMAISSDNKSATFTAGFTEGAVAPFEYTAILASGYNAGVAPIVSSQTPAANNIDGAADILVAKPVVLNAQPSPSQAQHFQFKRVVSINKMTIRGLEVGEKVTEVTISGDKQLAAAYNFSTDAFDYTAGEDEILLGYSSNNDITSAGTFDVYFVCAPVENATLSIEVKTEDNSSPVKTRTYKKTFTRTITFDLESVAEFVANVTCCEEQGSSEPTNIFTETFDSCNKTGGNDDVWSSITTTGSIITDNSGWSFVSGNAAYACARFGAGSTLGHATSPALGISTDEATLSFKAGAWKGDAKTLKLSIVGNGTISPSSVTLTNEAWDNFTATISDGDADTKIKFEGQKASNARFFLDEVVVSEVRVNDPNVVSLTVADDTEIEASSTEATVSISSNKAWTVTSDDASLSGTPLIIKGTAQHNSFTVNFAETNTSVTTDKVATLHVVAGAGNYAVAKDITVTQKKVSPILKINNKANDATEVEASVKSATFTVTQCNFDWDIVSVTVDGVENINYTASKGENGLVTVYFPSNEATSGTTTTLNKSIVVTVGDSEIKTATYTITQDGETYVDPNKRYFIEVTSAPEDWSGQYLIVSGSLALPGNNVKDQSNIGVSVDVAGGMIEANPDNKVLSFTIAPGSVSGEYSIRGLSGYIGRDADSNGIDISPTAENNTLEITNDVQFILGSSGRSLRYNSNYFRYYGTKTQGNAIRLYKFNGTSADLLIDQLEVGDITVTPGDRQLTFSWDAVENASSYLVYWNGSPTAEVRDNASATTFTKTDLTAGTSYHIEVVAVGDGVFYTNSEKKLSGNGTPYETPVTPTFSPDGGSYTETQTVTIATTTSGADIYYTTGNSNYSAGDWTLYSTPVSISSSCTLKAVAVKGGQVSEVKSSLYTIGEGGTDHEATIIFGYGNTKVDAASVTGDDSQGNTWTVTTVGTTSFTNNNGSGYSQIGSSNKPATSITFTTTLSNSATIKAFSAKFGGFSGTAGTITLKVGDTTVGSGNLNGTSDVTVNASNTTTAGTVLTVTVTGISKGVKAYEINVTYNN